MSAPPELWQTSEVQSELAPCAASRAGQQRSPTMALSHHSFERVHVVVVNSGLGSKASVGRSAGSFQFTPASGPLQRLTGLHVRAMSSQFAALSFSANCTLLPVALGWLHSNSRSKFLAHHHVRYARIVEDRSFLYVSKSSVKFACRELRC
jgi:hypothetical protein